jgi:hypothetical protein
MTFERVAGSPGSPARARRGLTSACLCLFLGAFSGCRMTPDEISRIQLENELLREQIRVVRQNCSYYRDVRVEVEDEAKEPEEAEPPD